MHRLVDVERLIETMKHWKPNVKTADVIAGLQRCQTVDAVEVVRCKDCQHFEKKWSYHNTPSEDIGCGYCWHWEYETGMSPNQVVGDDFCSYGERRDVNEE